MILKDTCAVAHAYRRNDHVPYRKKAPAGKGRGGGQLVAVAASVHAEPMLFSVLAWRTACLQCEEREYLLSPKVQAFHPGLRHTHSGGKMRVSAGSGGSGGIGGERIGLGMTSVFSRCGLESTRR